jgi:hypothetical protein
MSRLPQSLTSSSINPANLLEIQVLTQVIVQLQNNGDVKGSIPYLAKITQIIDNQKLDKKPLKSEGKEKLNGYYKQLNQYQKVKADAHAQLADAYFKTRQYMLCESTLLFSVKIWEKLVLHTNEEFTLQLKGGYEQLKVCYENMGKLQLAQHIDNKLIKMKNK